MSLKIKIAIDTRDQFLAKTGIRTVMDEIIWGLQQDPEIEVIAIQPKKLIPPKSKLQKAWEHLKFFWWKEVQLPLRVKKSQCDVLICNDYVVPYFLPKKVKALPVFHGCNIWELPEHYNKYWRKMFTHMAVPAARKAHAILTVSEFSKSRLIDLFGFDQNKIQILPLGPKRSLLKHKPLVGLEKFGIKEKDRYLLHVGVMEKRKNLVTLIKAFHQLSDHDLKLVLVGQRGPKLFLDDYDQVISIIQELKLKDRVVLTGFVTDEELYTLYSQAKAYVFPSLYEGFGIPVIEAFHFDLAVAAANRGALPEVVGDGGLLFDPEDPNDIADKIQTLLDADQPAHYTWQEGRKAMMQKYNWEETIQTLKKVIKINDHSKRHA